ncbi:MAG TPA: class I SAM-dependent RNA methyltransferase [Terriglobia bacterium]|nr:class I SAM-dependent RNA methyltransferase [Terriglobia bacterium]
MFEFTAQKLVYGGDALGYHQGRTVLVPRALPGERVAAEEVRTAKGVVHARPLRVLVASPDRVDPPCPYFGRCGGCQYQHLGADLQTAYKRDILRETLRPLGRITWDRDIPLHAASSWQYRNQAELKVGRLGDGKVALGFFAAESHHLIPIDACLILSPRLDAILGELRRADWLSDLGGWSEIELAADDRDEEVRMALRAHRDPAGRPATQDGEQVAVKCLALPGVVSVAVERGRELRVFGKPSISYAAGDFVYQVSPGSFFQASRFLLAELAAAVTSEGSQSGAPPGGALALDLYAGVGLFTLPLARRFDRVIGVEANARSAADLAANAAAHRLSNIRAVPESAFDFLRRFAQTEPDLVVLDPPRAGVGFPSLKLLAGLAPKGIHYVSCHPPTLARDLAFLIERGYQLDSVELFDFFPHTFHIESVTRLSR